MSDMPPDPANPIVETLARHSVMLGEITEMLLRLTVRADLLEAHSENLIERMRALEIFTDYDASLDDEPPKARSIPSEEELEQRTRDAAHGA